MGVGECNGDERESEGTLISVETRLSLPIASDGRMKGKARAIVMGKYMLVNSKDRRSNRKTSERRDVE